MALYMERFSKNCFPVVHFIFFSNETEMFLIFLPDLVLLRNCVIVFLRTLSFCVEKKTRSKIEALNLKSVSLDVLLSIILTVELKLIFNSLRHRGEGRMLEPSSQKKIMTEIFAGMF